MRKHIASWLRIKPSARCCPKCNSAHLIRTHRRFVDRLLTSLVSLKRYRCELCGWSGNFLSEDVSVHVR